MNAGFVVLVVHEVGLRVVLGRGAARRRLTRDGAAAGATGLLRDVIWDELLVGLLGRELWSRDERRGPVPEVRRCTVPRKFGTGMRRLSGTVPMTRRQGDRPVLLRSGDRSPTAWAHEGAVPVLGDALGTDLIARLSCSF
ncbi:hypothetical protein GCM10023084_60630 [Streptomyces lacrimifluminis]|uniref:Uncharacterized protein n=1 Tax=Streptomyces lacrimifluminis TaxID=1500077 RepID=A0A917KXK8_9ACTN|nr:hypothetical protein GCM10012282_32000 [Streptomyces lacrimifluminis]